MPRDNNVWGFDKPRAQGLKNLPLDGDVEFPEIRPRGSGGGGARLVQFVLTASLASGTATATFTEMDGGSIGSDTLRDPRGIFSALGDGDDGLAIYQGGKYWVIQANCPATEYL
jgi:hypothetical protein